jgi:hypothetical protein
MYDKHNCIFLGMYFIDRTPSVASCVYKNTLSILFLLTFILACIL